MTCRSGRPALLLVSMLTFASGRTNVLQGAVHRMLFLSYLMLLVLR